VDLTCSECGKTYNVDESKMDRARGRVTCLVCGHVIVVEAAPVDLREKETLAGVDLRHVQPKIQGMSIRMKITLIMVALVLGSLSVVGGIATVQSGKALSEQVENQLLMSVRQKATQYSLVFERIQDEGLGIVDYASKIYGRKDIEADLDYRILLPWNGTDYTVFEMQDSMQQEILKLQRVGHTLQSIVSNNPYLDWGYMGTETGLAVFNDNEVTVKSIEEEDGYVVTDRPWYKLAKKAGHTIWTQPYVDATAHTLVVTCATPVYDGHRLVGVIGFDVLLDTMKRDILKIDIGYNSYAFLINQDGKALVKPDMTANGVSWDKEYTSENLTTTANESFNAVIKSMVGGSSGITSCQEAEGVSYISYAPLKVIGASLAIVASKAEVVKPALAIRNLILFIWVVVLLVSILIGMLLGNSITRPLNRLTVMADLISQGKMDLEVIQDSRKDEIGVLTKSINRLVISLKLAMRR